MNRRRLVAWGLPIVLVAATGSYFAYRAYTGRCAASFPTVEKVTLPPWWTPDRPATGDGAEPAAAARAATGIGPFGAWVGMARSDDSDDNRAATPVEFLDGRLVLAVGQGALPYNPVSGALAAVDPASTRVIWTRGYEGRGAGGGVIDAGRFASQQINEGRPEIAAIRAGGDLAWCTRLDDVGTNDGPFDSVELPGGELAFLHPLPAGSNRNGLSVLSPRDGEVRWSGRYDERFVALNRLTNRLLLTEYAGLTSSNSEYFEPTEEQQPVLAIDADTRQEVWRYAVPPVEGRNWAHTVIATTDQSAIVLAATQVAAKRGFDRFRLAAIDRDGRELWHADDSDWGLWLEPTAGGRRFGELLVTFGAPGAATRSGRASTLVARRLTDGSIAWTAKLDVRLNDGLTRAEQVGDFLLAPGGEGVVVVDMRTGKQVGRIGHRYQRNIAADDRYVVIGGPEGLYVWRRA